MKAVVATEDKEEPFIKEIPEPEREEGEVKVKTLKVGVDGTDLEVIEDVSGRSPLDDDYIVLGHEAVGVVVDGTNTHLSEGDIVTPTVRRPHPDVGYTEYFEEQRPDMSPLGEFVERGIINAHGYMQEYFVSEPEYLVEIPSHQKEDGFLIEPLSISEKGLDMAENAQATHPWGINDVLILGNGRLGLLTSIMMSDEYDVTTYSLEGEEEYSSVLAEEFGVNYISAQNNDLGELRTDYDLVIETTGHSPTFIDGLNNVGPHGVYLVLGIDESGHSEEAPIADVQKELVFNNQSVIGSVNSHVKHFESAIDTLEDLPRDFLEDYVTLEVPVEDAPEAFTPDTVKSVVVFGSE